MDDGCPQMMSKVPKQTLFGLLFVCAVALIQLIRSWTATASLAVLVASDGDGDIHHKVTLATRSSSSLQQSPSRKVVLPTAAENYSSVDHVKQGNLLVTIPSPSISRKELEHESSRKEIEWQHPEETCFISSYGKDGIGHQLEAKLSCIATAMALNMTYVHQPMDQAEHGSDAQSMEQFLSLDQSVPILGGRLWDDSAMRTVRRHPLPKTGDCPAVSWFDPDNRIPACRSSTEIYTANDARKTVFSADNCWDYFYCALKGQATVEAVPPMSALWQNKIGPTIRQYIDTTTLDRIQNEPREASGSNKLEKAGQPISIRVVAHVRRGSGRARHLPLFHYSKIIQNLETAAAAFPIRPQLDVVIHTNVMPGPIRRDLKLRLKGASPHLLQNLQVFGKDSSNTTIQNVLEDITTSDIFIASESSLSHVGGLLRFPQDPATIIYPQTTKRAGLAALGWNIVQVPKGEGSIQVFHNKSWAAVGHDFWTAIIGKAKNRKEQNE